MAARRYVRLSLMQLRATLQIAVRHRTDAMFSALAALLRTVVSLVPLWALFEHRPVLAGWTRNEAFIVVGWFLVLKGIIDATIQPSLLTTMDHVRKGTLDGVLLKPADAHFLVASSMFDPWRAAAAVTGIVVVIVALVGEGRVPGPGAIASTVLLLASAVVFLHALWLIGGCAAFVAGRVEPVAAILASIFDAARWPVSVFHGTFAYALVFPLCAMTTYPALATLGRLSVVDLAPVLLMSAFAIAAARAIFRRTIRSYVGAGR